jgi:hypothetical protein
MRAFVGNNWTGPRKPVHLTTVRPETPAMRNRSLFLSAVVVSLSLVPLTGMCADDQVYRWVDADGVPHYSDSPPPDDAIAAREITVRNRVAAQTGDVVESTTAVPEATTSAGAIAASRQQFCQRAKDNLKTLQESGDVMQDVDGDGIKDLLSAEQREAERKRAQNAITFYCDE